MRVILRYPLLGVVVLSLGAIWSAAAPVKIRVGYSYWLPNVPLDVAEAHGWFKEEGLEVSLVRLETSQLVIGGVQKGELDLATDMIGSWIESANQGNDIVIMGETDWSHGGDKIVARGAVELASMEPKRIGVYLNNLSVLQFLSAYLATQKLTLADYSLVEIADDARMIEAFKSGKLQLVATFEPVATTLVDEGQGRVLATTADYPGVMPEGFAGNGRFVRAAPAAALEAFFRVWYRAVAYVTDPAHAAEVAKLASETTLNGTATYTAEELPGELAKTPLHSARQAIVNNTQGGNLQVYYNRCLASLIKSGRRNPAFNPKGALFTGPLLNAAAKVEGLK